MKTKSLHSSPSTETVEPLSGSAVSSTANEPPRIASNRWQKLFVVAVSALFVLTVLRPFFLRIFSPNEYQYNHYFFLASHLVRGDLTIDGFPDNYPDYVIWQGHKYLPLGPLPGIVLIPFLPLLALARDQDFPWVGHLFTLLNIWLFAKVLLRVGVSGERRNWSLLLFFGGTVYLWQAVLGDAYHFAHILTTTCLLAAIWEALGKRRPILIGLYLGLAGMTRFTALFTLPFFLWLMWRDNSNLEAGDPAPGRPGNLSFFTRLGSLSLGLAGPIFCLGAYNYLRFGNPLESGYGLAQLGGGVLTEARTYGLFSLVHVPKNLFMMLLQGPLPFPSESAPVLEFPYLRPSRWGMGIFFTSPVLLYIFKDFRSRLKEPLIQACWLGTVCALLPIITYYGIGYIQFGYRYALDFLPFLLLIAARNFSNPLSNRVRALILVSVVINVWGALFFFLWSFW